LRDKIPEMEYFFTDTGKELKEVYDFLSKLEVFLNKKIIRLGGEEGLKLEDKFDHYLYMHYGMLPSRKIRWCTVQMKIKPFEKFIGNDEAISYIGIRADEDNRKGYLSTKTNIKAVFPFIEDGIKKADVFRILQEFGVGIPEYYQWRSRSGCTFCFYQRKDEWLGLAKYHPDKFKEADKYEQDIIEHAKRTNAQYFTWHERGTLRELLVKELKNSLDYECTGKESIDELIKLASNLEVMIKQVSKNHSNLTWQEQVALEEDDDAEDQACLICSL